MSLVNWKRVTNPKNFGGLGIRDFNLLNQAFLGKLAWCFISNYEHLWVQVLKKKYIIFSSNGQQIMTSNCSITWKVLRSTNNILSAGIKWIVGNGNKINFWSDTWLNSGPLRGRIQGPLYVLDLNVKISGCIN